MSASTRTLLASAAWASALGATLSAAPAWAQPAPETTVVERSGITAGIGLGFGSLELGNESNGTLNYELQFGGYLNNQWALQLEVWGGAHDDGEFHISNLNRGLSAQYWMADRNVWWKVIVGASTVTTSFADTVLADFAGAAVGGGCGWMFYQRGSYRADARFGLTIEGFKDTDDNAVAFALGIGLSYF